MQVDVVDDAGAGGSAEVPAEVVAVGGVLGPEGGERSLGQLVDLERFGVGEAGEVTLVADGGDHEVAGRVRIAVQKDKGRLAAVDDELLFGLAEDAAARLVGARDVFEPPGRP